MGGAEADLRRGDSLGRYLVLDSLGRGGMGVVVRAFDPELDRTVAIKLVSDDHEGDPLSANQLLAEAQAMAKLSHPNVVSIHDVGVTDAGVFIAMELVDGDDLERWLEASHPFRDIIEVFIDCARGLAAAHAAGLVHGDFKPGNVFVTKTGSAKVGDFGLARPVVRNTDVPVEERERIATNAAIRGSSAKYPGGTIGYLAPECEDGGVGDPRADQYSFCVALHDALVGRRPDVAEHGALTLPRELPSRVRRLLRRALSIDPNDRFETMDEVADELVLVRQRRAILTRRLGAGALVAIAAGSLLSRTDRDDGPCSADSPDVWTQERSQQLGESLLASQPTDAQRTWSRTREAFDHYVEQLERAGQQACEATFIRHEQSTRLYEARALCYAQAWEQLDAVVTVLADGPPGSADLDDPTAALMNLDVCGARAELLLQLPQPADSETERRVEDLRQRLARVQALLWSGRGPVAREEANKVLRDAEALSFAPIVAEATLQSGLAAAEDGDYVAADERLAAAHWVAEGTRHDRIAAEAATAMIVVVGVHRENAERGEEWANHADAAVRRYGVGGDEEIDVANARATLRLSAGDSAGALASYERAIELMDASPVRRPPQHASALEHAAVALESLGRFREAQVAYQGARRELEEHFGAEHPRVGQLLHNVAVFHHSTGDYEAALEVANRSLSIKEKAFRGSHPSIARTLQARGVALLELRRTDEARAAFERAREIVDDALGLQHPERGVVAANLGAAAQQAGELVAADRSYQRALSIFAEHFGPSHALVAEVHLHRGRLLGSSDDWPNAVRAFEQARKMLLAAGGPEPLTGQAGVELAAALTRLERLDEAGAALELATGALQRSLPPTHPLLARARIIEGRWLLALQDPDRAIEVFALAYELMAPRPDFPRERAEAATGWAGALRDAGHVAAASAIIDRARADLDAHGDYPPAAEVLREWKTPDTPSRRSGVPR